MSQDIGSSEDFDLFSSQS